MSALTGCWTPDNVEILTRMWQDGHGTRAIADKIPGASRSAIIGKAHRLGLQRSAGGRQPSPCAICGSADTLFVARWALASGVGRTYRKCRACGCKFSIDGDMTDPVWRRFTAPKDAKPAPAAESEKRPRGLPAAKVHRPAFTSAATPSRCACGGTKQPGRDQCADCIHERIAAEAAARRRPARSAA